MKKEKNYNTPEMEMIIMKSEGFIATSGGEDGFKIPPFGDGIDITDPLS